MCRETRPRMLDVRPSCRAHHDGTRRIAFPRARDGGSDMTAMDRTRRLLLGAGLLVAVGVTAGTAWAAISCKGQVYCYGTSGADVLQGTAKKDLIYGMEGNDTLTGGRGNDSLRGDALSDTGADGNDVIYGGSGDDSLIDGGGSDFLVGGSGNDHIS